MLTPLCLSNSIHTYSINHFHHNSLDSMNQATIIMHMKLWSQKSLSIGKQNTRFKASNTQQCKYYTWHSMDKRKKDSWDFTWLWRKSRNSACLDDLLWNRSSLCSTMIDSWSMLAQQLLVSFKTWFTIGGSLKKQCSKGSSSW